MSLLGDRKKGRRVAKQLAEYALYRAVLLLAEASPEDATLQERAVGIEEILDQAFDALPSDLQWERSATPDTRTPVLAGSLYVDQPLTVKPRFT